MDSDIPHLAGEVKRLIENGDLFELKNILRHINLDERRQIVNFKIEGNAALYTASEGHSVDIINFLLDECGADINMKGVYREKSDEFTNTRHDVTPLWCSSTDDKLDIVKTLVEHGADINCPSDTESTPVRAACFSVATEVVKYLVEHGADIHKANIKGGTCLNNAVRSPELVGFLLDRGATIDSVNHFGNTALHVAVDLDELETAKLLLSRGASINIKNKEGNNVLRTAALGNNRDIVDAILVHSQADPDVRITAYELLGTSYAFSDANNVKVLDIWKEAMALRFKDENNPIRKTISTERRPEYLHLKEVETVEELQDISGVHFISIQAILARERILGESHPSTISLILQKALNFEENGHLKLGLQLCKRGCLLRHQIKDENVLGAMVLLVQMMWDVHSQSMFGNIDDAVLLQDVNDALKILSEQAAILKDSNKDEFYERVNTEEESDKTVAVKLILHTIHLMTHLSASNDVVQISRDLVRKVIEVDPRCKNGYTLTYLALDKASSSVDEELMSRLPCPRVISCLLDCGADINVKCPNGVSPLLRATLLMLEECPIEMQTVFCLMALV